jgi:hypothetical protein
MNSCKPSYIGSKPAHIVWEVVRGDTAEIDVEFFEEDEKTYVDISSWFFTATAYNRDEDSFDELEVNVNNGYITIFADSIVTENWGINSRFKSVAELRFDLEVRIDNRIWTPVIGTIFVTGDVTGSG